jgi:hypothetical protein
MSKLRDNQALLTAVYGIIAASDHYTKLDGFGDRVEARKTLARDVINAVDRATATGPARDTIIDICLDVQQRRATVYEAADRIEAATGPGRGAAVEEALERAAVAVEDGSCVDACDHARCSHVQWAAGRIRYIKGAAPQTGAQPREDG